MFRDFADNNNLVVESGISPLTQCALAASGPYCAIFNATMGSGEVLISQIQAVDRIGNDSAAEVYLANMFDYVLNQSICRNTYRFDDWYEDYESYSTGTSTWFSGTDWLRLDVNKPGEGMQSYNSFIVTDSIGGNTTKKAHGASWHYGAWHVRTLGEVGPVDEVTVTGQVAKWVEGHATWPMVCHIWVGGVGIGISGNNISYGNWDEAAYMYWPPVTKVGNDISLSTWYDVKIDYHQVPGVNNDRADLYYKKASEPDWITVVTDYNTMHDLGSNVATIFCNDDDEPVHEGYIDNVLLFVEKRDVPD